MTFIYEILFFEVYCFDLVYELAGITFLIICFYWFWLEFPAVCVCIVFGFNIGISDKLTQKIFLQSEFDNKILIKFKNSSAILHALSIFNFISLAFNMKRSLTIVGLIGQVYIPARFELLDPFLLAN